MPTQRPGPPCTGMGSTSKMILPRVGDQIALIARPAALLLFCALLLMPHASRADSEANRQFNDAQLKGTWVFSGLLRFAAPAPLPATLVDGAPPHDQINPGDEVGLWASILGTMTFDGAGNVTRVEDVVKIGDAKPLSPPVPFDYLPPLPEIYTGTYAVSNSGVVEIALTGRSLDSPEGQVDFEFDLHCLVQHRAQKMRCVPARFRTRVVDPNGYPAPITGVLTVERQH
jgi:hypothetical protein